MEKELSFPSEVNRFCSFVDLLILRCLDPGKPFKWDAQGTDIFVVAVDVTVDELGVKLSELESKVGEFNLMESSETDIITTQNQITGLV